MESHLGGALKRALVLQNVYDEVTQILIARLVERRTSSGSLFSK